MRDWKQSGESDCSALAVLVQTESLCCAVEDAFGHWLTIKCHQQIGITNGCEGWWVLQMPPIRQFYAKMIANKKPNASVHLIACILQDDLMESMCHFYMFHYGREHLIQCQWHGCVLQVASDSTCKWSRSLAYDAEPVEDMCCHHSCVICHRC